MMDLPKPHPWLYEKFYVGSLLIRSLIKLVSDIIVNRRSQTLIQFRKIFELIAICFGVEMKCSIVNKSIEELESAVKEQSLQVELEEQYPELLNISTEVRSKANICIENENADKANDYYTVVLFILLHFWGLAFLWSALVLSKDFAEGRDRNATTENWFRHFVAPVIWNSLPEHICKSSSSTIFKK